MTFTYEDEERRAARGERWRSRSAAPRGRCASSSAATRSPIPARADEELAAISGVPTEGFFRSTASVRHHELAGLQRDEGALRDRLQASISGADRGDQPRQAQARAGAPRPPDARHQEPGPAQGRRGRGRPRPPRGSRPARTRSSGSSTTATRSPVAREHRAEAETALAERRSMLEKARQAERLTAERDAAQEKYDRYRTAVTIRDEIADLERTHPSPTPLPVLRASVDRLRAVDAKIGTLQGMLEGEIQVNFEVPPEVRWRPLSRWSLVLVLDRRRDRGRQLPAELRQDRRRRRDPDRHRRHRGRDRARARHRRLVAAPRPAGRPVRCATSRWPAGLRGRSEIEQELREAQAEQQYVTALQ